MKTLHGHSISIENIIVLIASIIILFYCLLGGAQTVPDTAEYLNLAVKRPPLYPLLTNLFRRLFGYHYFFHLIFFQICLILTAALSLSHIFRKHFELPSYIFLLVYFLIIVPLLPAHRLYGGIFGNIGNMIASEPLAYALFTFSLVLLVKSIFVPSRKKILLFSFLCVLNVLTRPQMLFMYPVIIVLLLLQWIKHGKTNALMNAAAVFLLIFIGFSIDKGYHRYVNGAGSTFAIGSYDLLATVLFVSAPADADAIKNPDDRNLIRKMLNSFADKKALLRYHREAGMSPAAYHSLHFTTTIIPERDRIFSKAYKLQETDYDRKYLGLAALAVRVLPSLLKKNWFAYLRLIAVKFLDSFTFREGFFIGVLLMLCPWRARSKIDLVFMICLFMVVLNRLILSCSGHFTDRMLFYTDNFEQVILAVLLGTYIKSQSTDSGCDHANKFSR